jgi:hypothetical protein
MLTPLNLMVSSLRPLMRECRGMSGTAGTVAGNDAGDVPGPVTDQRGGLLAQGGDHHFAPLAVGHRLQGLRIDDFQDVVISPSNGCSHGRRTRCRFRGRIVR